MAEMPIDRPSPNHGPRPGDRPIDMLLLHYTDMTGAETALARLCDPDAQVSAHYLVAEDGRIYRLVAEDRRAWHAGTAWWAGETDINSRSIGIELANPGHSHGYRRFPGTQIEALTTLCRAIVSRHSIPPHRVLGHSDVAPDRKIDPGHLFDWRALAAVGIGLFPEPAEAAVDRAGMVAALARIGYRTDGTDFDHPVTRAAFHAFQRHWVPERLGQPPDSRMAGMLENLARSVGDTEFSIASHGVTP